MAKKKEKVWRFTTVMRGKLGFVFFVIICLFLTLVGALIYRMMGKGTKYESIVLSQQKSTSTTLPYERGKIYDRNGNILAANEKLYTLVLEPKNILLGIDSDDADEKKEAEETKETVISVLCEYFGCDAEDLEKTIEENASSYYVVYLKDLTYDDVADYKEFIKLADETIDEETMTEEEQEKIRTAKKVTGVNFEESYKRVYPYNSLACKILGFTSSGNVGNWGIEQYYNDTLNGTDGRSYYHVNEELEKEQTVVDPINGNSVVSTIDLQVQQVIEEKLKEFDDEIGSKMTSILVMNPQNGEILGMATSNPYDLNNPMDESSLLSLYSQEEIDEMKAYTEEQEAETATTEAAEETTTEEDTSADSSETSEEEASEASTEETEEEEEEQKTIYDAFYELWRNSIISDTNEPGSTFKPFTVAAGLQSGVLTGDESYYCSGSYPVGSRNIGCSHVHDAISLKNAVAKSCNVSMMNIVFDEGADTFYYYQNLFGFGRKTGVDLPGEADTSSLVYDADNYSSDATLATNSFGQNFNCTMIQMAAGFSSLINGGYYYKPRIVKQIQSDTGDVVENLDRELLRQTVSEEVSATLRDYLTEVVESGTGTKAQLSGYTVGGKTGTAEKIPRNKEDYYVSFIGFTPAEDPQLLIYVTIDEPNVDDQANAALAVNLEKECMKEIVGILGIEATGEIRPELETTEEEETTETTETTETDETSETEEDDGSDTDTSEEETDESGEDVSEEDSDETAEDGEDASGSDTSEEDSGETAEDGEE